MVKGYNRFSKKGGKLHEMHGGATYDEILVPFIVFKQGAVFVPQAQQTQGSNVEFIENDDRAADYRGLDWSVEYDLARNGDPNDTQTAL